ncbi:MAG: hypothetical protein RL497_172 [Pseudomonadota bacterium]|jgi:type IV pilus assembly protein PilW
MNQVSSHKYSLHTLRGFSLIELMVAMLIGLLVLSGVIQVVLNSKRSFLDNQETAFIQDNTRYALDIIAKDFRSSGYNGCANNNDPAIVNVINDATKAKLPGAFDFSKKSLSGLEGKTPEPDPDPEKNKKDDTDHLPKTIKRPRTKEEEEKVGAPPIPDTITLRTVSNENEVILNKHNPASGTFTTWQKLEYKKGTPLIIIDANCQNIALLLANAPDDDATEEVKKNAAHNMSYTSNTANCDPGLTAASEFKCGEGKTNKIKPLSSGSSILPYVVNTYFIGKAVSSSDKKMPALKRRYIRVDGSDPIYAEEEIAQGVENMQITYGLDNTDDNTVNVDGDFITAEKVAATAWDKVVAIKIELTLRSNLPVGKTGQPDDYLRKFVSSTISMRN